MKQTVKYIIVALLSCLTTLLLLFFGVKFAFKFSNNDMFNLVRLTTAYEAATHAYVHPVDNDKIANAGIKGMMEALDDPYSVYLDKEAFKHLAESTSGNFTGIGAVIGQDKHTKEFIIFKVLQDAPAEKAGLKADDKIVALNGKSVKNYSLEELVSQIRGPGNTEVKLTIARDGKEQELVITRKAIESPTVAGEVIDYQGLKIGYIQIGTFTQHTASEFNKKLQELQGDKIQGLIIDLRNNPGGLLNSVVDVGKTILPAGNIVSTINRNGNRATYAVDKRQVDLPMVALINNNSASAAEILAGALQDTDSAVLVGEKSFGKGSVQTIWPLLKDDGIKITIAKYYTPKMRSIDKVGLEPDVKVDGIKAQYDKALEILAKKIKEQNKNK